MSAQDDLTPLQKAAVVIRQLRARETQLRARVDELEAVRRAPIAVVGMGCRLPGGDNPDHFWRSLQQGTDATCSVPADRWPTASLYDPDPEAVGRIATQRGGFLGAVDGFDPSFFGMTPREAAGLDPQHRLLLEVAWESLEHAGIAADSLHGSETGVFVGIGLDDYAKRQQRLVGPEGIDAYTGSGNGLCFASGRLSYLLGLHGPSLSVDTACSSSLVAVHLACRSLRQGECGLALAAGVNLMLSPEASIFLSRARALAPDGRCKTFSAQADGYGRGEGCGVLVLKRLGDARADGDTVLAVIRGSAMRHDGAASGLTVPNGAAQQLVMRAALADAGVEPAAIDYVEAHGTGTALGDPIELRALAAVYGPGRPRERPLRVGSVKTNTGHLETAAGVTALIKVVLALGHRELPPSLHSEQPTPHFDWAQEPLEVVGRRMFWPEASEVGALGRAAISGFGLSGTNVHLVVEEAEGAATRDMSTGGDSKAEMRAGEPARLFVLSAPDAEGLRALASRHADALDARPALPLDAVARTLAVGRAALPERMAIVSASAAELRDRWAAFVTSPPGDDDRAQTRRTGLSRGGLLRARAETPPRVALVFTGQGSLQGPVDATLYDTVPVFRQAIDTCARLLDEAPEVDLRAPLAELLFAPEPSAWRADAAHAQPALFALAHALAETWRAWGVTPVAVLGHSLGELVAAHQAGVMSLADALTLVAARGRLFATLDAGSMVAVSASAAAVREALSPWPEPLAIAAINSPRDVVLSGEPAAVAAAVTTLETRGVRCQVLPVDRAFHSPMVAAIEAPFAKVAEGLRFVPASCRWISTLTGREVADRSAGYPGRSRERHWVDHLRAPVRFEEALGDLSTRRIDVVIEIGARPALLPMVKRCWPDSQCLLLPSLRPPHGARDTMLTGVGTLWTHGTPVSWESVTKEAVSHEDGRHEAKASGPKRRLHLPTYPFQRQRCWFAGDPAVPLADPRGNAASESGLCYRMHWLPVEKERSSALQSLPGRWVLMVPAEAVESTSEKQSAAQSIADALADRLRAAGDGVTLVGPDQPLTLESDDPRPIRGIVYLRGLNAEGGVGSTSQLAALGGALELVQDLLATARPRPWLVTTGAQAVRDGDAVEVAQAPLWGLGRSVALERPALGCGLIDLDRDDPHADLDLVVDLLRRDAAAVPVAVRQGQCLQARLARWNPPAAKADRAPSVPRADAAYLITGGLGDLGLALANWLVARGARHLILAGRRPPSSATEETLAALRSAGAVVGVVTGDVANPADVARMVAPSQGTGLEPVALAGVFHAAGVEVDGLLEQQTWDRCSAALAPKVVGAMNLHQATVDLPLDCFVLFASVAGSWGSPAQAPYAAANAGLDALAHQRVAQGLPALAVDWGPWAEVGLAARASDRQRARLAGQGLRLLAPRDALDALGEIIAAGAVQATVADVDWATLGGLGKRLPTPLTALFADLALFTGLASASGAAGGLHAAAVPQGTTKHGELAGGRASWADRLRQAPTPRRRQLLDALVAQELAVVAGLASTTGSPRQSLFELGLDSLMALELKNGLEAQLGVALPTSLLFDYPSRERLVTFLTDFGEWAAISGESEATTSTPSGGASIDDDLESELHSLDHNDLRAMLARELAADEGGGR